MTLIKNVNHNYKGYTKMRAIGWALWGERFIVIEVMCVSQICKPSNNYKNWTDKLQIYAPQRLLTSFHINVNLRVYRCRLIPFNSLCPMSHKNSLYIQFDGETYNSYFKWVWLRILLIRSFEKSTLITNPPNRPFFPFDMNIF